MQINLLRNNINKTVDELCLPIEGGMKDPLASFVQLKKLEEIMRRVKKRISDLALDEACKDPRKTFEFQNAEITKKNSAGRWDFSQCQEIVQMEKDLKELKEVAKAASKIDKFSLVNEETGEVNDKAIYTPGSETLSIKLLGK
tara:strand:- start:27 stop:455 length:429 start_codon:yes stop_codon:yes gene_type:complete